MLYERLNLGLVVLLRSHRTTMSWLSARFICDTGEKGEQKDPECGNWSKRLKLKTFALAAVTAISYPK